MLHWEHGIVTERRDGWQGVARLQVRIEGTDGQDESPGSRGAAEIVPALAYPELTGEPAVGERVLLNTNALRRELGTGGEALVVARPDAPSRTASLSGHMVKARYTPMQTMVDAIDDPASEHYATLQAAESLEGMPVVVADLHSSLPAIVAGVRADAPEARIAYIHTDAAALPAAYSATAAALRRAGMLTATISAGQSFGGDLEAVTVHSALLGARHVVGADVAVAIQGPGNLGTGTGWGFSGVQAAEALHAAHVLGGAPVAALRVSGADPRQRHRGLSHHSATILGRATLVPVRIPVPGQDHETLDSAFHLSVQEQLQSDVITSSIARGAPHRLIDVPLEGLREALESVPVRLSTMGRGLDEDPWSFLYAALAGRCAAGLLTAK